MKTIVIQIAALLIMCVTTVAQATFSSPVPVQIETNYKVAAPSISKDELTVFFYHDIGGQYDMFYSTRAYRNSPFSAPISLTGLNTAQMEVGPDISSDGLSLYFARGDAWENDIFISTRQSTADPFGSPSPISELNTEYREFGQAISDNELEIFFASTRLSPDYHHLFKATRPDRNSLFGTPVPISELNTSEHEYSPSISTDGLTLYYTFRNGPSGYPQEIWAATRQDINSPFNSFYRVEELNMAGSDTGNADISHDGRTIYFTSVRPGSLPGNLWMATVIPEPSMILIILFSLLIFRPLRKK